MSKNTITIDVDTLNAIVKNQVATELKNKSNSSKSATKRRKGTYQLMKDGTVKLQYMLKGERYYDRRNAKDDYEAERVLAKFVEEVEKGAFVNTDYTFAEFSQIWLDESLRPNASEHTVDKDIGHLNLRILPFLGSYRLKELNTRILENYFNKIKFSKTIYKNRENKQVSPDTVEKWKAIVNAVLNYAVKCELLTKNPCSNIKINYTNTTDIEAIKKLVEKKRHKIKYFTLEEYKTICMFLENEIIDLYNDSKISDEDKLREVARRILILVDFKTGMRRSELFGLARNEEYDDLDLDTMEFDVNKSRHYSKKKGRYTKFTKNIHSIRRKQMPKSLKKYVQIYFNLLDDLHYTNMYIFDHLNIDSTSESFWKFWLKEHKIRVLKFHSIRHTHASILLYLGTDLKTISERLGHSSVKTTADIYADVIKELEEKVVDTIDKL